MSDTLPRRRSIRLQGFDYSQFGQYFLTICACDMHCLFGRIEADAVQLSPLGKLVDSCWREIPEHFSRAALGKFVVMPNHVHGILTLSRKQKQDGHGDAVPLHRAEHFQRPVADSIPTIIRSFKSAVTYQARRTLGRRGLRVWQSNYFERILRNDKEYLAATRYILENPTMWHRDKLHP